MALLIKLHEILSIIRNQYAVRDILPPAKPIFYPINSRGQFKFFRNFISGCLTIQDRYGRTVGVVHIANTVLNAEILKFGLAWYYAQYCKSSFCGEWQQIESQARSSKIGLWSIPNPQAPWDFRHGKKESGVTDNDNIKQDSVSSGNFHGNVSSKKFHKQGCKHYDCKSCTAIFGSRNEAVNAGYEPCGLCKP